MQYRRISADCHLDMLWLPPELFTYERVEQAQGPDAVCRRECGRRETLDR